MELENKEFLEKWIRWGDVSLEIEIAKLSLFRGIKNNLNNERIQRIINWEGQRITSHFEESGYCELCEKIKNIFINFDSSCSSSNHEIYNFVSETILFLANKNKELLKKIKSERIKKLKQEVEKLENEIKEERG